MTDDIGWRTMESAPRDGTPFLVTDEKVEWWAVVEWDDDDPQYPLSCSAVGPRYPLRTFTYWISLPPPPRRPARFDG